MPQWLQAQLLQSINIDPVQPRLTITDLNIVSGIGATEPGFNEFTPLFERNKARLVASGISGSERTLGGEAVLSGIHDRFSYSIGGFHYQADGFRPNNDIKHEIFDLFAGHLSEIATVTDDIVRSQPNEASSYLPS